MTIAANFPANSLQKLKELEAPSMWVNLDALDYNIAEVTRKSPNIQIRIASKSIRSLDAIQYILEHQKNSIGIMSFSPAEAEFLIKNGIKDILMGYPTLEKDAIKSAQLEANKQGAKLTFMVDLPEHLTLLNEIAEDIKTEISICFDLDMSVQFPGIYFGVYRSSIKSIEDLKARLKVLDTCKSLKVWGLMGYEAQVAGLADKTPGKTIFNGVIKLLKSVSLSKIAARRKAMADLLRSYTGDEIQINGGGTGSIQTTILEEGITEITVGSGYFQSHIFDNFENIQHHPAAGFALRITRNPAPNIYTCQSGGYIASGPIELSKQPKFYYPQTAKFLKNEGFGEVQTPFKYFETDLKIGDVVLLRHAKAGELSEHFNTIHIFKNDAYFGTWKTYRGNGTSFH